MARRLIIVAVALALRVPAAAAQGTPVRLADVLDAVQRASVIADYAVANPALADTLDLLIHRVRGKPFEAATVRQIIGDVQTPSFLAVSRRRQSDYAFGIDSTSATTLTRIRQITNVSLRPVLRTKVGADSARRVLAAFDSLHEAKLNLSLATSMEKLRRYERKFGPGSAQLNIVEVLLSYVVQQVPGFGPNSEGWPGPLELVAAYAPAYMTVVKRDPKAVSVGEAGIRAYIFAKGWGGSGIGGFLKPGHVSLGMAVTGEPDQALVEPWRGKARIGGFVAWGGAKVAYVGGAQSRWLVTRQLQLLPWVF